MYKLPPYDIEQTTAYVLIPLEQVTAPLIPAA